MDKYKQEDIINAADPLRAYRLACDKKVSYTKNNKKKELVFASAFAQIQDNQDVTLNKLIIDKIVKGTQENYIIKHFEIPYKNIKAIEDYKSSFKKNKKYINFKLT